MERCIQCGHPIEKLCVQYSPGNIRLMRCEHCKAVADEYIECEIMILLIDLILHKPKAYRHLLYNMFSQASVDVKGLLWKSSFVYLLLDTYRTLVLSRTEQESNSSASFSSILWRYGKILMDVFLGNFSYLSFFLLAKKGLTRPSCNAFRRKDLLLAMLISSYFKIFLIAMMVWEFHISVIFIIDLFVMSSNTVALKVITESTSNRCMGVCFTAHAAKIITNLAFNFLCRDH